jgi:geranylgeranyl diphosphate synthase type II
VGGAEADTLPVACALEMIHTYSLIHDDLPVMDDDDLRRGRPSNHKVFGEAVAMLAGDGLLTEAFNLIAAAENTKKVSSDALLKVIGIIARASGYRGMIGGQLVDIQWEGKKADPSLVEFIHTRKTGALITASVVSGAILAGADDSQIKAITTYGEKTGLAFQIADDILDIEGDSNAMGKKVGADEKMGKVTYPAVIGLAQSREIQGQLIKAAIESLVMFDSPAEPLRMIARYIVERNK